MAECANGSAKALERQDITTSAVHEKSLYIAPVSLSEELSTAVVARPSVESSAVNQTAGSKP
jgi:hypothetical protein